MSLADLLNNYSQEIGARVQHNEEVEQDNIDRKATTMQEKFEHAQSVIEGVGTELTSLGGAFHLGRKMYKKYQAKYGKNKAKNPAGNEETETSPEESGAGGDGGSPANEDGDPDRTGGEGAEGETAQRPAPTDGEGSSANSAEGGGEAEAQASAEAPTDEPTGEAPAQPTGEAPLPSTEGDAPVAFNLGSEQSQAQRSAQADELEQNTDAIQGDDFGADVVRQAQARANQATQSAQDQLRTAEPVIRDEGASDAQPAQASDAPHGVSNSGEDSSEAVRQGANDAEQSAVRGAEAGADEGSTLTSSLTGARNAVMSEADAGVGNMIKQGVTKVASKVGGALGDVGGLATTEGVLDALGPVGEAAGAIVGLVSLFENLFHKPDKVEDTGPVQTQAGGIDPTALAQKVPVVGEVL